MTTLSAFPVFTNEAITFGLLIMVLALIFHTASSDQPGWKTFYKFVPALLLCYFIPALLNWPLGLISPHWYDASAISELLPGQGLAGMSYKEVGSALVTAGVDSDTIAGAQRHSSLYFVASRYLLPASLILFCLGIDLKGLINLGPKSLIMFFSATLGIMIGGPIALLAASYLFPGVIEGSPDDLWRGLSTIAGSWIGGGANQTAMKEIYKVGDNLFGTMIVVDVVVANIWMGFLLYGASVSDKVDKAFKADNSAIKDLEQKIADYRGKVAVMPTTSSLFGLLGVAFGGVALSHLIADLVTPFMRGHKQWLQDHSMDSLTSPFFWLVVSCTTIGLLLSLTKARRLEGVGASRWGSIFIYILVATIGMKMNLGEVFDNLGLFAIGLIWMLVHVSILLLVAKLIKAPFFFVAVGSQANIGGAASAPIVASAFSPSLAPVGVLMAVLGYAMGTYGAIVCAQMMAAVAGG